MNMNMFLPVVKRTQTCTHIRINVNYQRKGDEWLVGPTDISGVYCYVLPVIIEKTEKFILGKGEKTLLLELAHKSNQKTVTCWDIVQAQVDRMEGPIWKLVEKVMKDEKVELLPHTTTMGDI